MTTNIGDGISVGNWRGPTSTVGATIEQRWVLDFVPVTTSNTVLAALQHTTAATALTLAVGTGVTLVVRSDGVSVYQFDSPRCVSLTSSADMSGGNFTLVAYDQYGARFTSTMAGPNTNTVNFPKAAYQIVSITAAATDGTNNVSAGNSNRFGLPYRLDAGQYFAAKFGITTAFAADAGTLVVADTTSPATASTTDVRGTYTLSAAADSSKRAMFSAALTAAQIAATGTQPALLFGVTQV